MASPNALREEEVGASAAPCRLYVARMNTEGEHTTLCNVGALVSSSRWDFGGDKEEGAGRLILRARFLSDSPPMWLFNSYSGRRGTMQNGAR